MLFFADEAMMMLAHRNCAGWEIDYGGCFNTQKISFFYGFTAIMITEGPIQDDGIYQHLAKKSYQLTIWEGLGQSWSASPVIRTFTRTRVMFASTHDKPHLAANAPYLVIPTVSSAYSPWSVWPMPALELLSLVSSWPTSASSPSCLVTSQSSPVPPSPSMGLVQT